jgi:hypothetical protein
MRSLPSLPLNSGEKKATAAHELALVQPELSSRTGEPAQTLSLGRF